jgi:hypothetical protein
MKHLENLDTNLDALAADPAAYLEFIVGGAPVLDIHCDKSAGAARFVVRMLKSENPRSGPSVIETPDRRSVSDFLKSGFPALFLASVHRGALARLVAIPAA